MIERINVEELLQEMEVPLDHAQPIWLSEFGETPEPVEWVIEGMLARGEVSVLYSDAGVGKSYVALHMAYSVASGRSWLGYRTEQSPVLILDSENSKNAIHRRLLRIVHGMSGRLDAPLAVVCERFFDLGSDESIAEIERLVATTEAKLLVIDSLMDFLPGRDENSVKDMLQPLQSLKSVARSYNCAVILLHHSNKIGSYRGSSAIKGIVDNLLGINITDDNIMRIRSEKMREGAPIKLVARVEFGTELDKFLNLCPIYRLTRVDASDIENLNEIQAFLLNELSNGERLKSELVEAATREGVCSARTANDQIYKLQGLGLIERTNPSGSRRVKAMFGLTTRGKNVLAS